MSEIMFHYGALADSLEEQAKSQGYILKNAERWQKLNDSMIMCWIYGIVTDSQKDKMMDRFQKKMIKDLEQIKEQNDDTSD